MNKKLLVFSLMILISMSFVYAFTLKDVLSGRVSLVDVISGKATYPTGNECIDTDGSNYYTKGIIESTEWGRSFNYADECITDNILREYYCSSTGEISSRQYTCAYGCRDGACLTQNECSDPDGFDYYTKQVSYGIELGRPFRYVDECDNNVDLREYYCGSTGEISSRQYTCPYGCEEGKCKIASCSDTDNGRDYSLKGDLSEFKTEGRIDRTDECLEDGTLRENYCTSTGEGSAVIYTCPYGCEEGKCKIASCSDTDNGANETIRGTLSEFKGGGRTDFTDECVTSSLLREYYCASTGEGTAKTSECTYGCKEGACLASNECTDTDSGTAYNTRGRTYGYEFGRIFDNIDYCANDNTVVKYYCSSGQPTALNYECPYGCREGICITKDCSENDNGIDFSTAGTTNLLVSGINTSRSDECASANTLNEYYCVYTADSLNIEVVGLNNNPGIDNTTYECTYGCSNGACLPQLCNDTDMGLNYTFYGEVIDSEGNLYTDSCFRDWWGFLLPLTWLSPTILTENYCEGNQPVNLEYTCPNGCKDGACRQESPCTDSDGGNDYFVKGRTTGLGEDKREYSSEDQCYNFTSISISGEYLAGVTLLEHYCSGSLVMNDYYNCPNGCSNGACVQ